MALDFDYLEEEYSDVLEKDKDGLILKAIEFAYNAHNGQVRKSGEPYITHPLEVARILAKIEIDSDAITACIMHDVVEDTDITIDQIAEEFNVDVASMVDGVTKLGLLQFETREEQHAESIRKMIIAMAKDIRVMLIKLADRLHNMRTLQYMTEEKQKAVARETLDIYAPIAHRLGISAIENELEDLCFKYLYPKEYYDLVDMVNQRRDERQEYIDAIVLRIKEKLEEVNIKAEIEGRPKHLYSIYRKMMTKQKSFDQIYDLTAIRVLVDNVKDCYGVLGIVHTIWKPIPGRFKDYIAVPKQNLYQSLHTTLMGENGMPFEVQIRTYEMHITSEYGIAAHWKYKEGKTLGEDAADKKLAWLKQVLEWQNDLDDPNEFINTLKMDLFTDAVFVFTPKGDVIDLVIDSTPIDFAYAIHSAVGNKCIGAKVNGKIVPIDYKLKTGDIVEVLTSKAITGPSRDWLKIVKTPGARSKIKQWFKRELKEENIVTGRDMLEKEAKRQGYNISNLLKTAWLDKIYKRLTLNSLEDMYAAIGYGGITVNQVLFKLIDEYKKENSKLLAQESLLQDKDIRPKNVEDNSSRVADGGITVKGENNMLVRFSKCCNPVPGDEIVGYVTRGRGVSVHRKDCTNIADMSNDDGRLIEVAWVSHEHSEYSAELQVEATDKPGLFMDITRLLLEMNIKLKAINARTSKDTTAIINLTVEISDKQQLDKVMKQLRKLPEVREVFRVAS